MQDVHGQSLRSVCRRNTNSFTRRAWLLGSNNKTPHPQFLMQPFYLPLPTSLLGNGTSLNFLLGSGDGTKLITTSTKDSWKVRDRPRSQLSDQVCHIGSPRSTGPPLLFQGQAASTLRVPDAMRVAGCLSRHSHPYISLPGQGRKVHYQQSRIQEPWENRLMLALVRGPSPIESEIIDHFSLDVSFMSVSSRIDPSAT